MVLRSVTPQDQAFVDALYASTRDDLMPLGGDAGFLLQLIKMQQQTQMAGFALLFPGAVHQLIEITGLPGEPAASPEPVGRVVVHSSPTDLRLLDIAVMPGHRRAGIGKSVLLALQHSARAQGLGMSLAVSKTNHAARQLYLAHGFGVSSEDALFEQMSWQPTATALPQKLHAAGFIDQTGLLRD
ncbi:MAG: GNAT family N-acetyltransferase [Pseudomonadota bacterium]